MSLIAHLTDFHLLEERPERRSLCERLRLAYLSLGRPLDPLDRRRKAAAALAEAHLARPDHLVITGDLTEDGAPGQFEALAEVLAESGFDRHTVTLVPGNHDLYADRDAWRRALFGPLQPWLGTSLRTRPLEVGQVDLLAVSTVMGQPVWRSAGILHESEVTRIVHAASEGSRRRRPLLVAQHHGPFPRLLGAQWMDGLLNAGHLLGVLRDFAGTSVLHGHDHYASARALSTGARERVFCAPAVVDHDSPLRLYWCDDAGVIPVGEESLIEVEAAVAA